MLDNCYENKCSCGRSYWGDKNQRFCAHCYELKIHNLRDQINAADVDRDSLREELRKAREQVPFAWITPEQKEKEDFVAIRDRHDLYTVPLYASPVPAQKENIQWFFANEKLPMPDETVWICVRNKNKPDGIWLHDTCSHDGGGWAKRANTWEEIVMWTYPIDPKSTQEPKP